MSTWTWLLFVAAVILLCPAVHDLLNRLIGLQEAAETERGFRNLKPGVYNYRDVLRRRDSEHQMRQNF